MVLLDAFILINILFFSLPVLKKVTIEEQLEGKTKPTTQFGRIMDFLGIEMFPASSSQAKGRIERLWELYKTD